MRRAKIVHAFFYVSAGGRRPVRDWLMSLSHDDRRLIGEDVILSMVPSPNPIYVKMDPVQIDQIMMNLAVNAIDAFRSYGMCRR